jgi:hypothetical protein
MGLLANPSCLETAGAEQAINAAIAIAGLNIEVSFLGYQVFVPGRSDMASDRLSQREDAHCSARRGIDRH